MDDQNPALAGLMMLAATDTGLAARTFSPIEQAIMMDLGYNLGAGGVADPGFSYVDTNGDGLFNAADGDVDVSAEVADGVFDTDKAEGSYTPIQGAGLKINEPITTSSGKDIKLSADGDVIINDDLNSGDDIKLTSRGGHVRLDDPTITAADDIELKSTGGIIFAVLAIMEATGNSKGEIELKAADDIVVDGATLQASKELELKSTGGNILAVSTVMEALGSSKGEIELKAAGDIVVFGAMLRASDEIELKSGGVIDATDSHFEADEVELKAAGDIFLTGWTVIASDIELKSGGTIIP